MADATSGVGSSSSSNPYYDATKFKDPTKITKTMFLQLLVAQLRNQDPLKPQDASAFLGQLAQMEQLESNVNMGQDIAAIRTALDGLAGTTTKS